MSHEQKLREEWFNLEFKQFSNDKLFGTPNIRIDLIADWWIGKMAEQNKEIITELESKKDTCKCGKYCVQDGRNEGLQDAIDLLSD